MPAQQSLCKSMALWHGCSGDAKSWKSSEPRSMLLKKCEKQLPAVLVKLKRHQYNELQCFS